MRYGLSLYLLLVSLLWLLEPATIRGAEDQPPKTPSSDAARANALAVDVHAAAAAIDHLPRFYYLAHSGNGDVDTMRDEEEWSLAKLQQAIGGPIAKQDWL